jgi:hypothetical protein
MEYIVELDNGEALPRAVADHLSHCARCRAEAERLSGVLDSMQHDAACGGAYSGVSPSSYGADLALTGRIMAAIVEEASGVAANQPTRLRSWIIVGALILVGVTGLRFSEVMTLLRQSVGPVIDVAMSVILGVFLTGYICMLVVSNMDRVLRIFRQR